MRGRWGERDREKLKVKPWKRQLLEETTPWGRFLKLVGVGVAVTKTGGYWWLSGRLAVL